MEQGVVIQDARRGGYDVGAEGSHYRHASDFDHALSIARDWMDRTGVYPNLFYVNERGNVDLLDERGNILQSWV
jgi:hypothetical protein